MGVRAQRDGAPLNWRLRRAIPGAAHRDLTATLDPGPTRSLVLPSGALAPLRIDSGIFPSQAVSSAVFLAVVRGYLGINGTLAGLPPARACSGFSLVAGCGKAQNPSQCCPDSALGTGSCAERPERPDAPAAFVALDAWPDLVPPAVASAWTAPGEQVVRLGLAPHTARSVPRPRDRVQARPSHRDRTVPSSTRYDLYLSLEAASRISASTTVAGTSWRALADESARQTLVGVHAIDSVLRRWALTACRAVRDTTVRLPPS